jgi:hypothetical protein
VALDTTVGGAAANSYASQAEADAYHEGRMHVEAWDDAEDADKERALRMATATLDAMVDWQGDTASVTQRLMWPRFGAYGRNGYLIAGDVIPAELKDATAEFARQLLAEDRTADSDVESQGLKRVVTGPVELEFKDTVRAKVVPDSVFYMIRHLGTLVSQSFGSAKLVRT